MKAARQYGWAESCLRLTCRAGLLVPEIQEGAERDHHEVVQAFSPGRLGEAAFEMPGFSLKPLRGGCLREPAERKTE
ncbi:MAG: hypothetical protein BWX88_01578 [Planctomycetes bacterium ADurb.Bin126]|nr:MAG: hypothetical protein BWX88_01578 [Planctomycetes bacterium ADurb.Bin126]